MKSKSLQSAVDHQQLQIYPSTTVARQPTTQQHQQQHHHPQQQSYTHHRIYHLSDDKINDIIFIEETPKIKVFSSKKIIHDSTENLSKVLLNRSNNHISLPNSNDNRSNEMKYITASPSSNQIYQDHNQSSILTVYSTSNIGIKVPQPAAQFLISSSSIPSQQQQQQQQHLQLLSGSNNNYNSNNSFNNNNNNGMKIYNNNNNNNLKLLAKTNSPTHNNFQQQSSTTIVNSPNRQQPQVTMIERSSSNSKYPTIHTNTSTHHRNTNNSQLSNDIKKFIPGRSIIAQNNNAASGGSPTPSIVSIVKPIISNVFLSKDTPPSGNQQQVSTATKQQQQSPTIVTRVNHRTNVIRSHTDRSPTALLSPVIYTNHQQQQNFYTSNQQNGTTTIDTILYNTSNNNNNNGKSNNRSNANKSPVLLTREKTSLSNYFTNIMNPSSTNAPNNNNSNLNSNISINSNNKKSAKQQQQHQQIFNSTTIASNFITKTGQQPQLNSSLSTQNINSMLISFNNGSKPNTAKHSNSFNYKYNLGNPPLSASLSVNRAQSSTNLDEMITGVSLNKSSAALLRPKLNSSNSFSEMNTLTNAANARNESRLLESVIHEMQDGQESILEANEESIEHQQPTGLPSSRSINNNNNNAKYSAASRKLVSKSKPVDKYSFNKQFSNATSQQQPMIVSNNKKQYTTDEEPNFGNPTNHQNQKTFDESLHFDENNATRNNLQRNSKSSFKETSTKLFGSILMPSKSTLTTTSSAAAGGNSAVKRQGSSKSYLSRDINDSYAYNDVKKYIDENDLMPPDRAEFIKIWIRDVNMCLKDLEQTVI